MIIIMEEIHSSTTKSNEYQEFSEDSNEDQSFLKYTVDEAQALFETLRIEGIDAG